MPRFALLLLAFLLAGCAPLLAPNAVDEPAPPESPEVQTVDRVAQAAWHRMEAGYLETGAYNTNVLADLPLPRGVRWTVASFEEDGYRLDFTSVDVPDIVWVVTPDGVERTRGS